MSRPLLKLCGGSGEILRDVRRGDIKSESLVARAPGGDESRHGCGQMGAQSFLYAIHFEGRKCNAFGPRLVEGSA